MNQNILDLTRKYFHEENFHEYKNKLAFDSSEFLCLYNQIGGSEHKLTIENIEYIINHHVNVSSDQTLVYINYKNNDNWYCVMLSYNNKKNINVDIIENSIKCIHVNNKDINTNFNYGDIMMKIIIDFAKSKGFETITLEDDSKYVCKGNQKKYNYYLKYGNVLTHGEPWYYKYGFRAVRILNADLIYLIYLIMNLIAFHYSGYLS